MNVMRIFAVKLFQRRSYRYAPLVIVLLTTYLAFHIQQDIRFIINKRDLNVNMSIPALTTTEIPFFSNTTEEELHIPDIRFPLDIDLEKAVRDKIESDIDIPHRAINGIRHRYVYHPPACEFSNTTEPFTLLILVKSSVRNMFMRDAIRETWGSELDENVKIAFLLGYSPLLRDTIAMENDAYNDIIMENFIDAYSNNTLKTIMGFHWAVNECPTANVILFIDDDHLPHMRNIMSYLRSIRPDQLDDLYCGYRINKGPVTRGGRGRWAIPRTVYSHRYWPPYLRGGAFVVSQKIARKFAIAFPYVRFLHVDDSYLGLVSLKLNILPQHDIRFMMDKKEIATQKQYFVFNDYKKPKDFKEGWETITSQ
ncbi:beta-1,3-galactosyltransferase brn-like [Pecten maximus]|uniref:beta-1,3-galactosyltransferase brn-like n=1 Tax=Pecten maximus TaxID=6579 RepID=UPI0014580AB5|nr:beta-1,3-galactosyltransferase brn-like [Pecten maximus]